ncbi:MAG: helix-turn-helix domain-containing protein [Zoogloeaceae bacterium]|nr:helix-turn-helix domain-containing protein [Zoogloeaceae bacterium]
MNQYERGKHWPDFGTAERLAAALDVPAAFFTRGMICWRT